MIRDGADQIASFVAGMPFFNAVEFTLGDIVKALKADINTEMVIIGKFSRFLLVPFFVFITITISQSSNITQYG